MVVGKNKRAAESKQQQQQELRRRLMISGTTQAIQASSQATNLPETSLDMTLGGSGEIINERTLNDVDEKEGFTIAPNEDDDKHDDDGDDENDEENIVIDMCDEDEDDFLQDDQSPSINNDLDESNNNNLSFRQASTKPMCQSKLYSKRIETNNNDNLTFRAGDLIWFDPNQLGYSIPGKIIDVYQDLQVLIVEGYAQPNNNNTEDDLETYNRKLSVADDELQVYNLSDYQQLSTIKPRLASSNECGFQDTIDLDDCNYNSSSLLESFIWNLKLRYKQELIYTNCGQKILISVNPFEQLNYIYDLDQANRYDLFESNKLRLLNSFELYTNSMVNDLTGSGANKSSRLNKLLRWLVLNDSSIYGDDDDENDDESNDRPKNRNRSQDAHIFALVNQALMRLLINGQDQCFVLLGESGSGKTEASKLLVQYLATINKSSTNLITEQILESIQVLESFGNAKTIHNDNSSRFGKLLEIEFNLSNGFILNAKTIDLNLLDKSRIVGQIYNERNYHIFYELLNGLSRLEKEKYGLQSSEKYFYLNQGNCIELTNKDDGEDFRSLLSSMQVLGFNYEEQDTIFRILASVLHLGNIYFNRKVLAIRSGKFSINKQPPDGMTATDHNGSNDQTGADGVEGIEGVEIGSDTEVRWISHLLQIQFESVMRCLTVRTSEPKHSLDRIVTPLNIDQALDTRDAIARTLYNCLFKWLIQRINVMISNGKASQMAGNEGNNSCHHPDDHQDQHHNQRPIYGSLCRTSESLCEFQPDKLSKDSAQAVCSNQLIESATITILDSFGFENLSENNFEQLCINYSAELLQYHTTRYLLRLEQAEYMKERLNWTPILIASHHQPSELSSTHQQVPAPTSGGLSMGLSSNSSNNLASVVNLISKKPLGILALLDDECNFPKATDQSFAEKCHHNHTLNENYQRARLAPNWNQEFGIRHFRQQSRLVWYQVDGFIEKNRDTLRPDILELLFDSKMSIVVDMLKKLHKPSNLADGVAAGKTLSRTYDGRYVCMKPRATTVAARFQDTLNNNRVLESINPTTGLSLQHQKLRTEQQQVGGRGTEVGQIALSKPEPWFIVCLKPNRSRTPALFDVAYVQEQVISMNLHEIYSIRKNGYPFRLRFEDFVRQYKCLVPTRYMLDHLKDPANHRGEGRRRSDRVQSIRDICRSIIEYVCGKGNKQYQFGLTKVFISERLHHKMEQTSLLVHQKAVKLLQKTLRMWSVRKKFLDKRDATIVIQAYYRAYLVRRDFWRKYMLVVGLQRRWRFKLEMRHRRRREIKRRLQLNQQSYQVSEIQRQQLDPLRYRQQADHKSNQQVNYGRFGLDIPDDLAQLYRLQKDWLPVHDLNQLMEVSNESMLELIHAGSRRENERRLLIERIEMDNNYSLRSFLSKYYTKETPQFGYSRLAISRPFNWIDLIKRRKLAIERSGPNIDQISQRFESIRLISIAFYKLVLRYIDSDNGSITEQPNDTIGASKRLIKFKLLSDYIIYRCIIEPQLRDEILLQLVSQSWKNPKEKSIENCWKFMLNCLNCFSPNNKDLKLYLIRYIIDNCSIDNHIRQCLLDKLCDYYLNDKNVVHHPPIASRNFPPSLLEYWSSFKGITSLALPAKSYLETVNGINDEEQTKLSVIEIRSNTTSQEFASTLLHRLSVPDSNLFGWSVEFLGTGTNFSSYKLNGDEILLDHISELELQPEFVQMIQEHSFGCLDYEPIHPSLASQQPMEQQRRAKNMKLSSPEQFYDVSGGSIPRGYRDAEHDLARYNPASSNRRNRVSSEIDLSTSAGGGLSQTSRLNRRYLNNSTVLDNQRNSGDYSSSSAYAGRYDLSQPRHQRKQLKQYQMQADDYNNRGHISRRRSMSMQELQSVLSSPVAPLNGTGRHFVCPTRPIPSNHYACSGYEMMNPSMQQSNNRLSGSINRNSASGSLQQLSHQPSNHIVRPRRSQTPNSMLAQQSWMSSSAYGSDTYYQGSAYNEAVSNSSEQQQQQQQQQSQRFSRRALAAQSGSLTRNSSLGFTRNLRPRRSASSNLMMSHRKSPSITSSTRNTNEQYQPPASDYASACCSEYERLQFESIPSCCKPLPPTGSSYLTPRAVSKQPKYKPSPLRAKRPSGEHRSATENASHYGISSAMSDTSEAPSLASHVRGIKVPQANGDLDQYLDDLFNPMLDDLDLDDMSDARSLATSIRGPLNGGRPRRETLLNNLCDASELSKIIRGLDRDQGQDQDDEDEEVIKVNNQADIDRPLSATFESLLTSLRASDSELASSRQNQILPTELDDMNLSELKALNEKLEHQIQAAQSNRSTFASEQLNTIGVTTSTDIPAPPPLPCFGGPGEHTSQRSSLSSSHLDDLYDRAKTIRIGKWRWPPAEQAASVNPIQPSQPKQQEPGPQTDATTSADLSMGSVGKLKISSEMKTKLEQLTNSGSSQGNGQPNNNRPESQNGSGIVSQVRSSLMALNEQPDGSDSSQVRRLASQRKNLLESQLLGSGNASTSLAGQTGAEQSTGSERTSSGSKVMAAKQQLAAAAGVALALLDSGSATNSQASSRRQSAAILEAAKDRKSRDLQADELGPQSRVAISQREAFYQMSVSNDADEDPSSRASCSTGSKLRAPTYPDGDDDRRPEVPEEARCLPDSHIPRPSSNVASMDQDPNGSAHKDETKRLGVNGELIAKTLAQTQKEKFKKLANGVAISEQDVTRDWIESSPDVKVTRQVRHQQQMPPEQAAANKRSAARKRLNNSHQADGGGQVKKSSNHALVYANVDWQLKVRKEIFLPSESYDHPLVVQMIFNQLLADTLNPSQTITRLSNKERAAIKSIMKENSISFRENESTRLGEMQQVKRDMIRMARSFALYFTRSYEARNFALIADDSSLLLPRTRRRSSTWRRQCGNSSGGSEQSDEEEEEEEEDPEVSRKLVHRLRTNDNLGLDWLDFVAVHHSGLRLVIAISSSADTETPTQQQQQQQQQPAFGYKVLDTLKYRDMTDVSLVGERELLVSMRNGKKCWLLYSDQAAQLYSLLRSFHLDYNNQPGKNNSSKKSASSQPEASNKHKQQNLDTRLQQQQHCRRRLSSSSSSSSRSNQTLSSHR